MDELPNTTEELMALSQELAMREENLIQEYKRTHRLPSRGIIITPEIKALRDKQKDIYAKCCKLMRKT